jgi:hypothetical protein
MTLQKIKKMSLIFVGNILLIYAVILTGLFLAQRSMIYFPSRSVPDLAAYGATDHMQVVSTVTSDKLKLYGWFAPPKKQYMPVIVFFHGNAAEHGMRYFIIRPYLEMGYGVLLSGYRGYGGNPGKPGENGFYTDARSWMDSLLQNSNIKPEQIVIYGESVGTGVAVQMALEYEGLRALILQSPYTSLTDVARKRYFFVPVDLLMLDRFNSIDKIGHVEIPLLVLYGEADNIIPPKQSRLIYEKAGGPKQIHGFEGYGHNDMPVDERAKIVNRFLSHPSPVALRAPTSPKGEVK